MRRRHPPTLPAIPLSLYWYVNILSACSSFALRLYMLVVNRHLLDIQRRHSARMALFVSGTTCPKLFASLQTVDSLTFIGIHNRFIADGSLCQKKKKKNTTHTYTHQTLSKSEANKTSSMRHQTSWLSIQRKTCWLPPARRDWWCVGLSIRTRWI